jgi:hypothetical protein
MKKLLALPLLAALAACGSIIHGGSQGIGFQSNPTNATVSVDNQPKGNTPVVVSLSRKDTHLVRMELAGYQPYEATITRSVSGWVWGNLIFGGLPGLAIDAITGGLYKLSPDQITAQFLKQNASVQKSKDGLAVFVVLKPEADWQLIGQLEPISRN